RSRYQRILRAPAETTGTLSEEMVMAVFRCRAVRARRRSPPGRRHGRARSPLGPRRAPFRAGRSKARGRTRSGSSGRSPDIAADVARFVLAHAHASSLLVRPVALPVLPTLPLLACFLFLLCSRA